MRERVLRGECRRRGRRGLPGGRGMRCVGGCAAGRVLRGRCVVGARMRCGRVCRSARREVSAGPEALLARDIGQRMLMKSNVACEGAETVMAVSVGSSAGAAGRMNAPAFGKTVRADDFRRAVGSLFGRQDKDKALRKGVPFRAEGGIGGAGGFARAGKD